MFDPFSRLYDGDIPLPRKYTDSYQPQQDFGHRVGLRTAAPSDTPLARNWGQTPVEGSCWTGGFTAG